MATNLKDDKSLYSILIRPRMHYKQKNKCL